VPIELNLRDIICLNVFTDNRLKHLFSHPRLEPSINLGFVQIIAIMAIQITERAGRLEHNVECHRATKPDGIL
jgi:hypothetical protein